MLHLLYILAFTLLAFLAVGNMIRNLLLLSLDTERGYSTARPSVAGRNTRRSVPHPELLDTSGNITKDPLLVMRSISVEDAREHLDALYEASPSYRADRSEEV
jgi:hypothetical protein